MWQGCQSSAWGVSLSTSPKTSPTSPRALQVLFAAVFAVIFLGRELNRKHFIGIACCVGGITLVGVSGVLSKQGGTQVSK